ncbi:GSCOCG00001441001-RA-CDS [Cotesia congregata]|uniref:Uncharacterized protein n=1 Tax=Cotesia congregata TaxID=51543 RepID=A0A8J2EI86_COTCN|nr:GSCOCG00001441001-RA-CDS [Cotesia congregata]CAG5076788.1 Protein of unknown function [Cotesia congregata]
MKLQFYSFSILILVNNVLPLSIPIFSDIQDIISLCHDVADISSGKVPFFNTGADTTTAKLDGLSDQISQLTHAINVKMDRLMTAVLKNVPKTVQFNSIMNKFIGHVSRIDDLFDDYEYYVREKGKFDSYTIDDFCKVTTSHRYGDVQDTLRQMYHLLVPGQLNQEHQSLLELMVFVLSTGEIADKCNQVKVPQQQLYDLYEIVVLAEVKSFVMASYSYGLLSIYKNVTFEHELDKAVKQVIMRCQNYLTFTTGALKRLSRELFLCDPPKHIEGETYFKINALRRVLAHESMLSESTSCSATCGDVDTKKYYRSYKYNGDYQRVEWTPNNFCRGRMSACQDLGDSEVCEQPTNPDSWYSWIKSDVGTFGEKDSCSGRTNKDLYTTYPGFYKCTSCFCLCSEENAESTATRTFSLRPQMADIKKNMVVTGLKWELQDNVVHIQIQQSKMLASSAIQVNSTSLVELEKFVYMDNTTGGAFYIQNGNRSISLMEGIDYSWIRNGQRDINLDNLYIQEPGWCITGLKLGKDSNNVKAVQLEAHITPFNFSNGLLIPSNAKPSKWITYKDMPNHALERTEIDVGGRDVPTKHENSKSSEDSDATYFAPTDKWRDVAQHTLPYFDKRLVTGDPPVPVAGAAIYLLYSEESGGMLGCKINSLDLVQYLNKTMVEKNMIADNSTEAAI